MIARVLLYAVLAALTLPACHGTASSIGDSCPALTRAEASEDTSAVMPTAGCSAGEPGNVCEVSSGGMTCNSVCAGGEYEVTCRTPDPAAAPVPDPDPTLGCKSLPLPTPNGVLFYCCPCTA